MAPVSVKWIKCLSNAKQRLQRVAEKIVIDVCAQLLIYACMQINVDPCLYLTVAWLQSQQFCSTGLLLKFNWYNSVVHLKYLALNYHLWGSQTKCIDFTVFYSLSLISNVHIIFIEMDKT